MNNLPGNARFPFTLLAKPAGAACNLACGYCFYLDKENLYPGSSLRMPETVLKAYIKQVLASQSEACIAWQGGEPTLMGLDFYKRSVELVNQARRYGQRPGYSIQTNGILLDESWCEFFKANGFLVGLSLDGPAAMHDRYRLDGGGRGTFTRVLKAWELLQKYQVDTNILCSVHAGNAAHALELYCFFRDVLGAKFIQFIPIVESRLSVESASGPGCAAFDKAVESVSPRSVEPEQYGAFLVALFEEWVHHDVGRIFVQAFDSALASWCGLPASVCIHQEVCGSALVLEHNGDLYSCDHFVGPPHRLGNILEKNMLKLANSPRQRQFGLQKRSSLPEYCLQCSVLFACRGECPRNRFLKTPDGKENGLNYLCAGYKQFFQYVDIPMRILAGLLRQGRAAAEIMDIYPFSVYDSG
jgi:uncharacterized protein